jgi:hypothetical protein
MAFAVGARRPVVVHEFWAWERPGRRAALGNGAAVKAITDQARQRAAGLAATIEALKPSRRKV